jgi:hypothetical protein
MRGGVFICCRRDDSAGFAGRIYDRLVKSLGRESASSTSTTFRLGAISSRSCLSGRKVRRAHRAYRQDLACERGQGHAPPTRRSPRFRPVSASLRRTVLAAAPDLIGIVPDVAAPSISAGITGTLRSSAASISMRTASPGRPILCFTRHE